MIMLLIAAIGALVAGVLAIVYGIPVKEFSFGNTMVLSGVMGICTGILMFGLWIATREMRAMTLRITAPGSAGQHDPSLPELGAAPSKPVRPTMREPAVAVVPPPVLPPAEPEPPVFPPFAQTEIEDRGPPPVVAPDPPPKPRRNLLFESSVRKDRDRAAAATPAAPAPPIETGSRTPIDDPIAQRGADRADRLQRARSPSTFSEPAPNASPDVTVLKSGVVDGMSYSLYSDGSIEAQMPEGMMRFASIDELRAHLDQRGA
jgi:hypothetical protein